MSTEDLKEYYADLLIQQYRGLPRAREHVKFLAGLPVSDELPVAVRDAFGLETAIGVQLDVVGKYAGVVRTFGDITLDDDDFRVLIKLAQFTNSNGSSTFDIQSVMNQYFAGKIFFIDYTHMRVGYFITLDTFSEDLAQVAILQDLLPYPMAVERAATIFAPTLDNFFGFRTYAAPNPNNTPMNSYGDYNITWPWLRYTYALTPENQINYFMLTEDGELLSTEEDGGIYL